MSGSKRIARPRTIPPHYETGAERRAASAGDLYYATISTDPALGKFRALDTEPWHVIEERDEQGNVIRVLHRPTLTWSEIFDEAEQLNGRAPLANNVSRGILLKPDRKVKADDPAQMSATEWFERLVSDPETAQKLRDYVSTDRALSIDDLARLMSEVVAPGRPREDYKTLDAVAQQLFRKLKIRRATEDDKRDR